VTNAIERAACRHCRPGPETFQYLGLYEFDVDEARLRTADGRQPVEVEVESVRSSMDGCRIVPEHLDHVDPRFPGIIAHVCHFDPSGEILRGHVIIDGNHRAARCLRDGLPFFAFLLTEEESEAILIQRPAIRALDRNPHHVPVPHR